MVEEISNRNLWKIFVKRCAKIVKVIGDNLEEDFKIQDSKLE